MSLIDLQRDIQKLCLAPEPDKGVLERLGTPEIFGVYRDMVRRRLHAELKFALKRTHAAAGDAFFTAAFTTFMAKTPPRSRFFHGIPVEFAHAMGPYFEASCQAPHAASLLAFEAARWEVSDLPASNHESVQEFDFDSKAVLNPTLRLLSLDYPVHELGGEAEVASKTHLLLYRAQDDEPVRHFRVNPVTFDLLLHIQRQQSSLSEAVQHVSQARKIVVDQAFIDGLCTVLADFLERRVVLGTQPAGNDAVTCEVVTV